MGRAGANPTGSVDEAAWLPHVLFCSCVNPQPIGDPDSRERSVTKVARHSVHVRERSLTKVARPGTAYMYS